MDITGIKAGPKQVLVRFEKIEKIGSIIVPATVLERESDRVVGFAVDVGRDVDFVSQGDEVFLSPTHMGAVIPDTERRYALFQSDDVWGTRKHG